MLLAIVVARSDDDAGMRKVVTKRAPQRASQKPSNFLSSPPRLRLSTQFTAITLL